MLGQEHGFMKKTLLDIEILLIFSCPWSCPYPYRCLFAPLVQKGIDKGKKSTRFWERCILGSKSIWAAKSTANRNWIRTHFIKIILYYHDCKLLMCSFTTVSLKMQCGMTTDQNNPTATNAWISFRCSKVPTFSNCEIKLCDYWFHGLQTLY